MAINYREGVGVGWGWGGGGDNIIRRRSVGAYEAGSLKTVAHAIVCPYGVYLYLYNVCTGVDGYTYWQS